MNKKYILEYIILSIIFILGLGVRLYKVNSPLADWHSWRQTDTASVSRIYVDEGINLLYPKYYDISRIQTGIINLKGLRYVEFPLFNVVHALAAKNIPRIGFEAWGRLISIASALTAAFFLYLIGKKLMGKWGGLLSAGFYLFIPYNIYFTRVILPEPLSVALGVAALWFFISFIDKEKTVNLLISGILLALSTLVKPFTFFYAIPILYLAIKKYGIRNLFKIKKLLIFANLAIDPFFIWRIWINQFPIGIPHFSWAFNGDGIRFRPAFWYWIFGERLGKLILGDWGLIPLSFGILRPKKNYFTVLFFLSSLLYSFVIATASVRHDYYQIFIIPSLVLLLAEGCIWLWNLPGVNKFLSRFLLLTSCFLLLIIGAFQVKEFYKINHPEIIEAGAAIDRIAPKDALVIAPYNGDTAFLYQTKRYGWPVVDESFDNMINKWGADYFVAVNFADPDVKYVQDHFKILEKTNTYLIADLHQKI